MRIWVSFYSSFAPPHLCNQGNDHYLSNVIIFSYTNTGVVNNHAANLFYGVHTWNNARGIGIDNNTPQARFIGVYLDYSYLRLIDPIQVIVESSFFLHTNAVLQAGPQAKIDGLVMQFNSWSSGFAPTVNGTFASCKSFTLDGGFNNPVRTIARLAVAVVSSCQERKAGMGWWLMFTLLPFVDRTIRPA